MMAECPQVPLICPQIVSNYGPQPFQPSTLPMPRQPIFPIPPHFGYPPISWSPIPYNPEETDVYMLQQHTTYNDDNENPPLDEQHQQTPHQFIQHLYTKNVTNKYDTKHEEFRKYLEEMGILSTFTNILSELYQDPLRPKDPLGYIQNKFNCSRPDTIELSNLRLWCDQYQTRIVRLEKELKHVIKRLRKYEPYNTDESLFDDISTENECKSYVLEQSTKDTN